MNNKELLEVVKTKEPDFLTPAPKRVNKHDSYICPLCNNGAGGKSGDGIAFNQKNGNIYYTCFNCGVSGSVFDWFCYDKGFKEPKKEIETEKYFKALEQVAEYYNLDYDKPEPKAPAEYKPIPYKPIQATEKQDTAELIEIIPLDSDITDYLEKRNINYKKVLGAELKAGSIAGDKYVYTVNNSGGLVLRAVKEKTIIQKRNKGNTDITLFNPPNTTADFIFITEGFFDSLSLYQLHLNSICLNSVSNKNKLYDYLNNNKMELKYKTFLLVLDNDTAGIETAKEIKNYLYDLGLDIRIVELFKDTDYKDINEFDTKDHELLVTTLANLKSVILTDIKDNNQDTFFYWWNNKKETETAIKSVKYSTGLSELDKILGGGLPVGLTVMGALSGVGKTTILTQIAENIAKSKVNVLFFSLEQPAGELFDKGLLRNLYFNHKIGYDKYDLDLNVNDYYNKVSFYYNLVSGDYNTTTYHILEKIQQIKKYSNKPVVIIVDYLQALKPCNMETGIILDRLSDKQATDLNIENLKMISKKFLIPIVAISSLNRQNYYSKIELDSFKETGNIEYTADIILGMDFRVVRYDTVKSNTETNKAKVSEIVDTEYKNSIKDISIITLKNRFARPRQIADLIFLAKYGVFTDSDTFYNPEQETDPE